MQETEKYGGRLQTVNVNSDSIKAIVQRTAQEAAISNRAERVELQDMQAVRQIAADYLNECAQSGFLPTVSGIASRLGRTRQALYFYASTHRGEPFDEWLTFFSDQCGAESFDAIRRAVHGNQPSCPWSSLSSRSMSRSRARQ